MREPRLRPPLTERGPEAESAGGSDSDLLPLPAEIADHTPPPIPCSSVGEIAPAECPRVLVVEPCKAHANALMLVLQRAGFTVAHAASAEEALEHALRRMTFHLILSELRLPGQSGLGLLRRVRQACPATAFFVLTGHPDVASSVSALALGASEYLTKPLDEGRLVALCVAAAARTPSSLRSALLAPDAVPDSAAPDEFVHLQAQSPVMRGLLVRLRGLSQSAAPVLLRGEPGAGKRLIGQVLHRMSARAAGPLIVVRPESLDPEQLRCTLWGCHPDQKKAEQPGAVVRASGGSLLITEVERLSAADRWLLARLITRGLYRPVGATQERAVAVRVLLTTSQPAAQVLNDPEEELLPGLRCVELQVPPLRERAEDLVPLATRMLSELAHELHRPPLQLPPESARLLLAYRWPGNGGELRATLRQAVEQARGPQLLPELLPDLLSRHRPADLEPPAAPNKPPRTDRSTRRSEVTRPSRLVMTLGRQRQSGPNATLARALRERRRQQHREAPHDGL